MTITIDATDKPDVYEAVRRVIDDIGGVGRDGYNDQQKFKFRSIEGTVNAVRPSLLLHGLTIVPSYKSIDQSTFTTSTGSTAHRSVLEGTFRFIGPAGDEFSVTTIGEAVDTQGRASNKAESAALKYCLLQQFLIGSGEDGDLDNIPNHPAPVRQETGSTFPTNATVQTQPPSTAAQAVAQRAQQIAPQEGGELRSDGQGKNLYRLYKTLESNEGWSRNDYLDQIEIISGFRDDRKLTKSQASDLIKTLKEFAGEADEPLPEYQESF